jgi:hypothetical protein
LRERFKRGEPVPKIGRPRERFKRGRGIKGVRLLQFNYSKTRISFLLTKHHTPSKHPQTPGE